MVQDSKQSTGLDNFCNEITQNLTESIPARKQRWKNPPAELLSADQIAQFELIASYPLCDAQSNGLCALDMDTLSDIVRPMSYACSKLCRSSLVLVMEKSLSFPGIKKLLLIL